MNAAGPTRAPERGDHRLGIAFGLGLAFLAAYQQFKLPVMLPVLLANHDYDRTLAGGFMSVYALFGLFLSIPLGRVIQRHGAASLLLWALALMILGNVLALAAPHSGWWMLTSRALEGIAFAVLVTVDTIARKLLNFSFQGTDELGGYALAVGSSLAFTVALIERAHIRIDLLHAKLAHEPRI